jgi:hypothetical protein
MQRQIGIDGSASCYNRMWAVRSGMSRSSKIMGDVGDISFLLIGVRLWGLSFAHDRGVATLQILWSARSE